MIIDLLKQAGISISKLQAGGGLTQNILLLKIYADVTMLPIEIASSQFSSALGASILGAVAGGVYDTVDLAVHKMVIPPARVIQPNLENHGLYLEIFKEYKKLVEIFGRSPNSPMKKLLSIRERTNRN